MQAWETGVYRHWAARSAGVIALCALVTAIGFAWVAGPTQAQDGDDPAPPVLSNIDDLTSDTTRLIVSTVRNSSPQTPQKLAKAVEIMVGLDLYQDARYYLSKIEDSDLDENAMFEFRESVGSDFFLMIQVTPGVQPEGGRLAKKVMAAASKVAVEPSRLAPLIEALSQPDIAVRSIAFQKLRLLGEPAVAEIVSVFADANRKSEFPGLRGALKQMGHESPGPLLGAARAPDPQVQAEAIRALADCQTLEALDVMLYSYLSPQSSPQLKEIALGALTRNHEPTDPVAVEERLYLRSMDYLTGKRQAPGELLGKSTIWEWDQQANRMVGYDMTPSTASRVLAFRNAEDLYRLQPDRIRNRQLYVLSQLEAAKRIAGSGRKVEVDQLLERIGLTAAEVEEVLAQALDLELIPASIACCEILNQIGDPSLVKGRLGKLRPLVRAILLGDRHLQFAAFEAIVSFDSPRAFPGSSYVFELAVFMAQSEYQPAGLVGYNITATAQTYAAALESTGRRGLSASTSRQLFSIATQNPDVDVVMVSDTMNAPDYAELIQQLQSDWRTRRIPIAFLFRDVDRSRRVDTRVNREGGFISVPFSLDISMIDSNVKRLRSMVEPFVLTRVDRRRHAATAIGWLAKVSADTKRYPYYDFGARQTEMVRLLYRPGFAASASSILANMGTAMAQRELVNFASQGGLPLEDRQQAVEAFARSVKVGGTLLTSVEIQQQYNRYNASEFESPDTQNVLGAILDVIESRPAESGL